MIVVDVWSVGCIFAELLGQRIFLPGQTGYDQLNLIIQKLGKPTPEEISLLPSGRAQRYLQSLPHYPKHPLTARFPNASSDAIDLLERMLRFEPTRRITVDQALQHPFLAKLTLLAPPEQLASFPPFDFGFDLKCKSLSDLKSAIMDEVRIYHSIATAGLPAKLSSLHIEDTYGSSHDEDERVIDGLLQRHVQAHLKQSSPYC